MFFAFAHSSYEPLVIFAIILGYVAALVIGFSMHEAAHAFVATKEGDITPKVMGRLTLNPIKHIDPVGLVLLLFVGFGYAKPVPINPNNFRRGRFSYFLVSGAGIFTNIILALFFGLLWSVFATFAPVVLYSSNFFAVLLSSFVEYGMLINISLAIFNILPIPPLDGFRMLESVMGQKGYKVTQFLNKYSWILMIVLAVIVVFVYNFIGEAAYWIEYGITWIFTKFFRLFL